MYQEIDYLLDDQRLILLEGGQMVQLEALAEIDRLLDIRNELGKLALAG